MNNYFNFKENNNKGRKVIIPIIIIALLIGCFFVSYLVTDRLTNPKFYDESKQETMVYNSNSILDDDMEIVLVKDGEVVKEQTIKEFKKDNDIVIAVNEYFVVNYFNTNGYELTELTQDEIVFSKESKNLVLEPNRYYLGEKDGYFAIYKTDKQGKLFIEEDKDVYRKYRLVNTIPVADQEEIKSFKHSYETKDEAKEILSGYIS